MMYIVCMTECSCPFEEAATRLTYSHPGTVNIQCITFLAAVGLVVFHHEFLELAQQLHGLLPDKAAVGQSVHRTNRDLILNLKFTLIAAAQSSTAPLCQRDDKSLTSRGWLVTSSITLLVSSAWRSADETKPKPMSTVYIDVYDSASLKLK